MVEVKLNYSYGNISALSVGVQQHSDRIVVIHASRNQISRIQGLETQAPFLRELYLRGEGLAHA